MVRADLRGLDQPAEGLVGLGPLEPVLAAPWHSRWTMCSAAVSIHPGLTRLTRMWWRISE